MDLSERHNKELPQAPLGLEGEPGLVRSERSDSRPEASRPGRPTKSGQRSDAWGVAWVVVGVCCVLVQPTLGCLAGSYGAAILLSGNKARSNLTMALVLSTLVCSGISVVSDGWSAGADTLATAALMAFVMCSVSVAVGSRKAAAPRVCLSVLVASAAYLAVGEIEAALGGTTMAEVVDGVVSSLSNVPTTLSTRAQVGAAVSAVSTFWPMAFVVMACAWVGFSYLGARLGFRRAGREIEEHNTFTNFEVPLWVVGVLLAGVVTFIAAHILTWWSSQLTLVGANVVMTARIGLAVQGVSLLAWLMRRHRVPIVVQAFVFAVAAYFEVQFFVMSVIGLVDVWANFRQIQHGGQPTPDETTK